MARSPSGATRRAAWLALLFALPLMACEDGDGTGYVDGGDVHGSWVVDVDGSPFYIRVLSTTLETYAFGDGCFQATTYRILNVQGRAYTLTPDDGETELVWVMERDGGVLHVDRGASELQLDPVDFDLALIPLCEGGGGEFPHPPCEEIDALTLDGSVAGTLGDGDDRWSDDTWIDLWSLQLPDPATVTITLSSGTLDTYLMLYDDGATERIAENDDIDYDAGNYNSRVEVSLDAGCYIVVANSYDGNAASEVGGDYTVAVTVN